MVSPSRFPSTSAYPYPRAHLISIVIEHGNTYSGYPVIFHALPNIERLDGPSFDDDGRGEPVLDIIGGI